MKVFKALVSFENENTIYLVDAIKRKGTYWLVPHWVATLPGAKQTPVRLVGIEKFPHQLTPQHPRADLVLNSPIPRAVFEGRVPPTKASGLVVIETPDIGVSRRT